MMKDFSSSVVLYLKIVTRTVFMAIDNTVNAIISLLLGNGTACTKREITCNAPLKPSTFYKYVLADR